MKPLNSESSQLMPGYRKFKFGPIQNATPGKVVAIDTEGPIPSNTHALVEIKTSALVPLLEVGDETVKLRRISPSKWVFELRPEWVATQETPYELHIEDSEDTVFEGGQVALSPASPKDIASETYTVFVEFGVRRQQAQDLFGHSIVHQKDPLDEQFPIPAIQLKTSFIFHEIDLLFLYHRVSATDDKPEQTKEAIVLHFSLIHIGSQTAMPKGYVRLILDNFNREHDVMGAAVQGLLERARTRQKLWAQGIELGGLPISPTTQQPDWESIGLTKVIAQQLAQSIGYIFLKYCRDRNTGELDKREARTTVLYFASGLARTAPLVEHEPYPLCFNAEPNSRQYCTFAEFSDLVVKHLGSQISEDEMWVWKTLRPAFVVSIELYAQSYSPYPVNPSNNDQTPHPGRLSRLLANGRDPRPDADLIDRTLNRIAYFADEWPNFSIRDRPGLGAYWGALLFNMQLRNSEGVLDGMEWKKWNGQPMPCAPVPPKV